MSRPSRTRKKVARKPTPLNATLQTIREDDDLVAATAPLSSTLKDGNAMRSKTLTSQRQRRQAKSVPTGTQVSVQVDFKAAFEALWNGIGPRTKELVAFHLGRLLKFTDCGRDGELAVLELCLSPAVCHPESVAQATNVTLFLAILRHGPVEVLRVIKALADNASLESDEDMTGSDLSLEKSVHSGLRGSNSDATMGGLGTQVSVQVDFKAAFEALWNEIGPRTKESVAFHLGRLLKFTDCGRDGELAVLELCFTPAVCHPESVAQATNVTLFLTILRDGPIEVLRAIKALADKASVDSDVDMTGSDSSLENSVPSGVGGSASDITMGGSDESTSDASMQDAYILGPNQLAPKTRVTGRINRPEY